MESTKNPHRQSKQQAGKESKTKREPFRILFDTFFHIALWILLWHLYGDAVGGYCRAVAGNLYEHLVRKHDFFSVLDNGKLPTLFNLPPAWSNMPGWVYVVGLLALVVVGVGLLIAYLKATRAITDKFWNTLQDKVREVNREDRDELTDGVKHAMRDELRRHRRILERWRRRKPRRSGAERKVETSDVRLPDSFVNDAMSHTQIEVRVTEIRDPSGGGWRITIQTLVMQLIWNPERQKSRIVDSTIPAQIPDHLDTPPDEE